jgi:hypothetical protein
MMTIMPRSLALAVLTAAVLLPACGGTSSEDDAEQAAISWAGAWTDEDTKRLCALTSKEFLGQIDKRTGEDGQVQYRASSWDHRAERLVRGPWTNSLAEARSWRDDTVTKLEARYPYCATEWKSVLDEHKRIGLGPGRKSKCGEAPCDDEWQLPSPEVTKSRVFQDSSRAEVEVKGSNGLVLILDMSKKDDSWLVDKLAYPTS